MKRLIALIAFAFASHLATAQSTTTGTWTRVAWQDGPFQLTQTKTIRFGDPASNRWAARSMVAGEQWCTLAKFGVDPAPGVRKVCQRFDADPAPVSAPTTNPPVKDMPPGAGEPLLSGFHAGWDSIRVNTTTELPAGPYDTGAFRTVCEPVSMLYDDPIVFYGQPGKSHLHTFFGNTGVNAYSTSASIRDTGKSSCRGGIANRSAYWVPSLIDMRTNKAVMPEESAFYYKTGYNGVRPQDVRPFPEGLRMIAGDPRNTTANGPFRWTCHNNHSIRGQSIPNCPVDDDLLMEVFFPQCWDGVNLDSPDHKSHMAYPTPGIGCPSTHPVPLPEISFNIHYRIREANHSTHWRLSSDNYNGPAGYSSHGDWWNGWNRSVMETWVRRCNNPALDCHSHLLGDGRAIY